MVLDGVSLDDRVVRDLTAFLERPLGQKLEQALLFHAKIVALTHEEKLAVFEALDRAPFGPSRRFENFSWPTTGGSEPRGPYNTAVELPEPL